MSEHSVAVVRLASASSAEREEILVGVQDLLLARGVIVRNDPNVVLNVTTG
ncbi:hypothetical protein AB0N38_34255 [Micromonospora aurantiaca]|uniref:hypothetical protein n=1 Tax=Micromonospora aurantiaca (nom. illeg.) TaxID=47850 RepID=UPI0001BF5392|nr:hypothetical protein [Micromonospora aurantiaca]ADL45419.1 hypothetical protein Micau_1869 [Micromonospora aurantiaca ATCC 27029]